jgi:two-component system sensor histidine kinase TctE
LPRELRDLIMTFNALLARLDGAVEGMRRFTADASHQMRTPLSILRTHINVLKMSQIENPRAQESLADIETATDRLQRLLIQLLALARADGAGPSGLELQAIDVVAAARSVAEEHALPALRGGVDLHFVSDDNEPLLAQADQVLITELIGNLVDNAVRYNQSGGSVMVHVAGTNEQIIVDVEDDGPGIPDGEHDKVFTRFYRLHRDQAHPGSGLGLSIVQVLAHSLGAQVALSRGPNGKGLRARVTLRRLAAA